MTYYEQIKDKLVNNEIYKRAKDYSKNKSDLEAYYEVGKLLIKAQGGEERAKYVDNLINEYSKKLINELNKKFTTTYLKRMRQFYLIIQNGAPLVHQLSWSHYIILIPIKDINKINYYINQVLTHNLSKRELLHRIRNQEYERLPNKTKNKLIINEKSKINDLIKNPIIIKKNYNYDEISEKILKKLILEDISNFMKELGEGYSFIDSEYKIKIGDRYNYIDLLFTISSIIVM